jgi:preprotein translocase subunit SecG
MTSVVLVLHLLVALALVFLVLMQRSEGGALGIGGGSSSLISGRGAADALAKATAGLATVFFITSITLTLLSGGDRVRPSVVDEPAGPSWFEQLIPADLFSGFGQQESAVKEPSATPPAPVLPAGLPTTAPSPDQVVPAPTADLPRAGPIDVAPLDVTPKPSTAAVPAQPRVAVVNPKPSTTPAAPVTTAAAPKPATATQPKPVVRTPKPVAAPGSESGEPAAAPSRAGPDE